MRIANIGICILLSISAVSCGDRPDDASLRAKVLALHRSFIAAHLGKNAAFIAEPTSPEYLFVADGTVQEMDADVSTNRPCGELN